MTHTNSGESEKMKEFWAKRYEGLSTEVMGAEEFLGKWQDKYLHCDQLMESGCDSEELAAAAAAAVAIMAMLRDFIKHTNHNAWKDCAISMEDYRAEIINYNKGFLTALHPNALKSFEGLAGDSTIVGKIEFVEKVGFGAEQQNEKHGIFKNIHVAQFSRGDSGDSWAGTIYAQVGKRWIAVAYEC